MQDFYTNVQVYGNKILYRGIEGGRRVCRKVDYSPTLFVPSQTPTAYRTVTGGFVSPVAFESVRDARDFVRKYEDIDNFTIYGSQRHEYSYIFENFPDDVHWERSHISVCNIDIEVGSENGFPSPDTASEPITAISYKMNGKFKVYGCGDYVNSRTDVVYVKCFDEIDLIKRFVGDWSNNYPDIITGWNIKFFDIPYLVNRITKMLGDAWAKRLSPWGFLSERKVVIMGREQTTYTPLGISVLDYIELYKKYVPGGMSQESYKLDAICHADLGERKLSYEEYGSLHQLYKLDYQKFIDYNIRDTELIEKLDAKHKVIDLVLTLSYDNKCNYDDVFSQVRMWTVIITNRLMKSNVVVPPFKNNIKTERYVGAYVKDPQLGMHKWVASFDLNSLYPHLIIQYNISPDTIIEPSNYTDQHRKVLEQNITVDTLLAKQVDTTSLAGFTLTPNGQLFDTTKQGFLPKIMEEMYNDRAKYKKEAIKAKKELERVLAEISRRKKSK